MLEKLRVALVHDYLVQYGGAERVLESLMEIFPKAPIYTLVYNKKVLGDVFGKREIRTSFLQRIPFARDEHHFFPTLMPLAIEQFDLSYYDLVISDSTSYAKGVITGPGTFHVCYCHTPMRYAWDDCHKYTREFHYPRFIKGMIPFGMNYIRIWDRLSAYRVDSFISNSSLVQRRIKKYYKKKAKVIHPPLFLEKFNLDTSKLRSDGEYYLMVGRLVSYKKFELGVKAFNKLGFNLKIVGGGPLFKKLKLIANKNIELVGSLSSSGDEIIQMYKNCKALIYPQEEDFGLVPLEAMAMGKPVIAYGKGGVLETVKDGKTGLFFKKQNEKELIETVNKFESMSFDPLIIQNHAKKFSKQRFKEQISNFIEERYKIYVKKSA